ncbi:MAG TPA: exopolysaccharide transport family protein [Planctomycetota bacterium]
MGETTRKPGAAGSGTSEGEWFLYEDEPALGDALRPPPRRPDPSAPETSVELPVLRFAQVVFRHALGIGVVFAVLFAAAVAWAFLTPPSYRSETKLFVQVGRQSVTLDPTVTLGGVALDPRTSWENELNSELEVARSEELRRAVVRALGADRILGKVRGPGGEASKPPGLAKRLRDGLERRVRALVPSDGPELSEEDLAALLLSQQLEVRLVLDSSVIKIGYQAKDPALAQAVARTYAELYLEKHLEVHRSHGSRAFLAEETERLAGELAAAEERLEALRAESGVISLAEQKSSLLARLGTREAELAVEAANVSASEAQVAALRAGVETIDEAVVLEETVSDTNPVHDFLRQQVATLRIEEQGLLETLEPDSRRVRAVREQIVEAEKLLSQEGLQRGETKRGANSARQEARLALVQAEAALAAQRARAEALRSSGTTLGAELARLTAQELDLARLERDIAGLERSYLDYAERLRQVEAEEAMHRSKLTSVRILEPAPLPLRSTKLGKKVSLAVGFVLALCGALAFAFVSDFLDQSLRSTEDVRRRLGLRALGSVPARIELWRWRGVAVVPTRTFAQVRDHLPRAAPGRGSVYAVTAPHRGEGTSTLAANLAASLAQGGGRVLLVDARVTRPRLQHAFELPLAPGAAEAARTDARPAPLSTRVEGLWLVPAGQARPRGLPREAQPVAERVLQALPAWCEAWRAEFEHVVLDLPCLADAARVPHVAATSDATVLVVAAGRNRWQIAREAAQELEAGGAPLAGVVLNRRRYPVPGWLYRRL